MTSAHALRTQGFMMMMWLPSFSSTPTVQRTIVVRLDVSQFYRTVSQPRDNDKLPDNKPTTATMMDQQQTTSTPPTMMVMKEHDPNDDPFAGLYQEEPTLVSPMEFGSGAIIHKPSMTVEQAQNTEESAEEESFESSADEASSSDEKEE
jgi:hypothetical protein